LKNCRLYTAKHGSIKYVIIVRLINFKAKYPTKIKIQQIPKNGTFVCLYFVVNKVAIVLSIVKTCPIKLIKCIEA